MTDEKCLALLIKYRERLKEIGAVSQEVDYNGKLPIDQTAFNHLLSMLPKMEEFIKDGRREKFFRWLGFMQGALWSFGEFSLNELRNHNRPPEEPFKPH